MPSSGEFSAGTGKNAGRSSTTEWYQQLLLACSLLRQIHSGRTTYVAVRPTGLRKMQSRARKDALENASRTSATCSRERSALYSGARVGFACRFPRRLRAVRAQARARHLATKILKTLLIRKGLCGIIFVQRKRGRSAFHATGPITFYECEFRAEPTLSSKPWLPWCSYWLYFSYTCAIIYMEPIYIECALDRVYSHWRADSLTNLPSIFPRQIFDETTFFPRIFRLSTLDTSGTQILC